MRRYISSLLLAFCAVSCVNEEYDISKIENDGISGLEGIALPLGSSKALYLLDIISLDPDGDLKVDEKGNYYIGISDPELINETIDIPDFRFDGYDDENPHDFTVNQPITIPSLASGYTTPVIEFTDVVYDIEIDQNDIPSMVGGITYADVTSSLIVKFKYDINSLPFSAFYLASGTTVTFPEWVILGEPDSAFKKLSGNELELVTDYAIAPEGSAVHFPLVGLDFTKLPENQGIIERGRLYLDAEAFLKGGIFFKSDDCVKEGTYTPIVTTYLHMDPMEIHSVKLTDINPDEDFLAPRNLDIADIIPGVFYLDGIVYDFNKLKLKMNLKHELPFEGRVNSTIETYASGSHVNSFNLQMPFSASQPAAEFIFCEDGEEGVIEVDGFNSLLNPLPENVVIKSDIAVDHAVVSPGDSYKVKCGYEFIAPLSFSSDFSFSFEEYITDLDIGMSYADLGAEGQLKFNIINTFPLSLSVKAQAIDIDENVIENVTAALDINIKSGTIDSPSVCPVKLRLSNLAGFRIEAIRLSVEASSTSESITINENQYMKLTDISVSLPSGLTYHVK